MAMDARINESTLFYDVQGNRLHGHKLSSVRRRNYAVIIFLIQDPEANEAPSDVEGTTSPG